MNGSHKIASQHLTRPAMVYVRQSTLDQVRHHHESRRRQYQLAERARAGIPGAVLKGSGHAGFRLGDICALPALDFLYCITSFLIGD
jgi:hypothetical protein